MAKPIHSISDCNLTAVMCVHISNQYRPPSEDPVPMVICHIDGDWVKINEMSSKMFSKKCL